MLDYTEYFKSLVINDNSDDYKSIILDIELDYEDFNDEFYNIIISKISYDVYQHILIIKKECT